MLTLGKYAELAIHSVHLSAVAAALSPGLTLTFDTDGRSHLRSRRHLLGYSEQPCPNSDLPPFIRSVEYPSSSSHMFHWVTRTVSPLTVGVLPNNNYTVCFASYSPDLGSPDRVWNGSRDILSLLPGKMASFQVKAHSSVRWCSKRWIIPCHHLADSPIPANTLPPICAEWEECPQLFQSPDPCCP